MINNALLCPWESPHYLIFSSNVPTLLQYSHIPTFIVALFLGIFIYFKSKTLLSKILLMMVSLFSLYVILDSIIWASNRSDLVMFLWSLQILIEPMVFVFSLYLVYVFVTNMDVGFNKKLFFFLPFLPFILLVPTKYNLSGIRTISCDANEGPVALYYSYALEAFFVLTIVFFIIRSYIREKDSDVKKKIILLGVGITLFLLEFSWGNIVGSFTEDWKLAQYGLFGMPIFMGFLVYIIVKFRAFNVRLIGAQVLIVAQVILIASMFAFIQSTTNRVLTAVTLLLTAIMGFNLVRSVKKEVALHEALEISTAEVLERRDELQIMADRLAKSNDQLRILDNAKSEFISIASHQLRTPLTAIKGFISLLLEGSYGTVEEKHKEVLNKIYTSNERLITLVEDLLNISRIESGRMEFRFDQWNVEKICQEVLDTFALRAKSNGLYLDYVAPETPLPEVTIDGVKVREVISNLVDNALKYTLNNHGGVTLKLQQMGENIRITVSDTGIGIPQTELPYLFAKFSRGKDISRLNTGGTGLGLYVGKNMIESNGGKIWAESDGAGLGSRFIIEIPLVQSEELMKRWGRALQ